MYFCEITDHYIPDKMNSCINLLENLTSEGYEMEPRSENLTRCVDYIFVFYFIYLLILLLYVLLL